jgi:hypothetical protein
MFGNLMVRVYEGTQQKCICGHKTTNNLGVVTLLGAREASSSIGIHMEVLLATAPLLQTFKP